MNNYILSIDQGTSSTKTVIFNEEGQSVCKASEPLKSYYSDGGRVEQCPEEIYRNVLTSVEKCLEVFKAGGGNLMDIKAVGISNQRETFVVWDEAGIPLYNAVVWQCKRSVKVCERLQKEDLEGIIRRKTGLIIDPYFSGTKLIWLCENIGRVKKAIDDKKAYFGTIDSWLLFKLSKGKNYFTDYTNASRTMFFNLHELHWDHELLELYGLSGLQLPEPKPSSSFFGGSDFEGLFDREVPITSLIGDSHAAAFGEGCFSPGTAKATIGTGCSIMMNTGNIIPESKNGMVSTICWSIEGRVDYALEGLIVTCGATLEWLKNTLGLFVDSKDTEAMACSVSDNNGVYLVPAFSGLGAPHWDMHKKASITGLTFDCNKNHIIRAALESIPFQIKDVIVAMESDTQIDLKELMMDGGITANQFVLQFLADLLKRPVGNIGIPDVSALGAAYLAGLVTGIFKDLNQLQLLNTSNSYIYPEESKENTENMKVLYSGWQSAVTS